MIGDLLLTWMSEIGSGTTSNLRHKAEWLARTENRSVSREATGRWLRDLSSLGHCEVDWTNGVWAISPAAIVRLPNADGTAILTGARRPRLMRTIETAGTYFEQFERHQGPTEVPMPTTILFPVESNNDLERTAKGIGVPYAGCASSELARMLPSSTTDTVSAPPAYDAVVEQLVELSPRRWSRRSARSSLHDGLFREQSEGRWMYTFHRGAVWYACDLASGYFAELERLRHSVLRWEPASGSPTTGNLFVNFGAPLPPLQSRALALCSGLAPTSDATARTSVYVNVPLETATRVAASLRQSLITAS